MSSIIRPTGKWILIFILTNEVAISLLSVSKKQSTRPAPGAETLIYHEEKSNTTAIVGQCTYRLGSLFQFRKNEQEATKELRKRNN